VLGVFLPPEQDARRFSSEEDIPVMIGRPQLLLTGLLAALLLLLLEVSTPRIFSLSCGGDDGFCCSFLRRIILTDEGFIGEVMTIVFLCKLFHLCTKKTEMIFSAAIAILFFVGLELVDEYS